MCWGSSSCSPTAQSIACKGLSQSRAVALAVEQKREMLGRLVQSERRNFADDVAHFAQDSTGYAAMRQKEMEKLDTASAVGELTFHIFASLAPFERQLVSERTKAGLAAARARGRQGGRPRLLTPKEGLRGENGSRRSQSTDDALVSRRPSRAAQSSARHCRRSHGRQFSS